MARGRSGAVVRSSLGGRMKRLALYFTAPYRVSVQEEPLAAPAPDQVMVQTLVSAISLGTELLFYRGQSPTDLAVDDTIAALASEIRFPLKYGYSAVGQIVAVGAQVAPEWQDRLVFSFHPHESHFLASLAELMPVPPPLAPEDAAFVPNMEAAERRRPLATKAAVPASARPGKPE